MNNKELNAWKERWITGDVKFVPEMFDELERLQKERYKWKDYAMRVGDIRKERDEWKAKAEYWKANKHSERDQWKRIAEEYQQKCYDAEKQRDEWKQRYADLLQEKNRYYRMYRETVNTLQEVKEKASLTVEGWAADHQAGDNEIEEWKAKAERLEKENEGLNKEIGMYTNKLFDIAQSCYKNGDEARELIAKMLKGMDSE